MKDINIMTIKRARKEDAPFWVRDILWSKDHENQKGFVAWKEAIIDPNKTLFTSTRAVCDGWNGSFHDPDYDEGGFLAVGKKPGQAIARLKDLLEKEGWRRVDSAVHKFQTRNLVRFGD